MNNNNTTDNKVLKLANEVFEEFGKLNLEAPVGQQEFISKEDVKVFLQRILEQANELDAWDDYRFERAFKFIDEDGNGEVQKEEFILFIKRFADL